MNKLESTWIVQDWAGNRIFPEKTFKTFDDAWYFLQTKFSCDDDCANDDCNNCQELQELYVKQFNIKEVTE